MKLRAQQVLNWLENEKRKDSLEIKTSKEKFIKELKSFNKEEFFEKPKEIKLTLWQRIKIVLLGN
jgi:uncharacterized protein YdaL